MDILQKIKECFESDAILYTLHAKYEMENEEFGRIVEHEVYEAVCNGKVIEEYPEDRPYPSALIFGKTATDRPLHVVCAYADAESLVIIITVYQPDPELWVEYKWRKKL
ncbi:MAG TPA: DUF4258 domain-containing protein [Candidatus Brocadiaceae bacterium]|nr:DUF4258 domain-containing protein [Candidatus Brocadiaceae bacterium]